MSEPIENVQIVCKGCTDKKKAKTQERIHNTPLENFIGQFVKLGFPFGDDQAEHMWVKVLDLAETEGQDLMGVLNNDPVYATDWANGVGVEFTKDEIEDVEE